MVTATIGCEEGRWRLLLKGHATGSAETCAAVSCLAQTLEGWLLAHDAEKYEATVSPGDVEIRAAGRGVGAAFEMVFVGLKRLERTDPERVRVIWEDEENEL